MQISEKVQGGPGTEPEPETATVGTALSFFSLVFFFPWCFSCWGFPWSFGVFSAHFPRLLRARKVRKFLGVFKVFLGIFEKIKEKKDRAFSQEPNAEPEPPEPFSRNRNRNRNRSCLLNLLKHRQTLFAEEPPDPKTATARTVPSPNRNQTEPGSP